MPPVLSTLYATEKSHVASTTDLSCDTGKKERKKKKKKKKKKLPALLPVSPYIGMLTLVKSILLGIRADF